MSDSFTDREFGLGAVVGAREMIYAGGFGPEDFALLDAVFQAAWQHIEIKYVETLGAAPPNRAPARGNPLLEKCSWWRW